MDDTGMPVVPGFELGELLARGGTSEVWAGVSLGGGQRVAVKVVSAGVASVEAAAREAAVSARAASAHVVPVEAVVPLDDGRVALVMPHLRGGSLDALVRARGHLSPGEVVTVLAPVASALGRLHDLGVVHGDLSPGNVLLDHDGRPALGDLGLGHVLGDVDPGVWGTDGYVAPEVVLGADPSPASDVYGIGALGWLCLTGAVPGAPGLRPALADVSRAGEGAAAIVAVLDPALSPDPGERPSADELAWSLFEAAAPRPLDLVRGSDETSAVTYRLRAAAGQQDEPVRSGRGPGVARRRGRHTRARPTRTQRLRMPRLRVPSLRMPSGGAPRWLTTGAGVVGGLALAALLVVGLVVLGREVHTADAGEVLTGAPRAGEEDPGGPSRPVSAADPRRDPAAPVDRPLELLTALAEARAAAWREATPAMLHGVDAPGSSASARDTAAVAEVARSGLRYAGLRYTVAEVQPVSATVDAAVVRARFDASAYTVIGPSGSQARPAMTGEPVLVDLVRTDAGWRVYDVRAVS